MDGFGHNILSREHILLTSTTLIAYPLQQRVQVFKLLHQFTLMRSNPEAKLDHS